MFLEIIQQFNNLFAKTMMLAAPPSAPDPYDYAMLRGSANSMRDRLRQHASELRFTTLLTVATPLLKLEIEDVLLYHTSKPLISMSRSDAENRQQNDLFGINLKQKLHLEIYEPSNCPTCLCGKKVDVFA